MLTHTQQNLFIGRRSNKLNILKAFIIGLLRQRTHQELANEKKLHLVEMRAEMGNYPLVRFIIYLYLSPIKISILSNPEGAQKIYSFVNSIKILYMI